MAARRVGAVVSIEECRRPWRQGTRIADGIYFGSHCSHPERFFGRGCVATRGVRLLQSLLLPLPAAQQEFAEHGSRYLL